MLRIAIQRKLITLGKAGPFYKVVYGTDAMPVDFDATTGETVSPASVRANETGSLFAEEANYKINLALSRQRWNFQLKLSFNSEAILEAFEELLRKDPPVIPADKAKGYPQVTLFLREISVIHPIQHQSASGTEAIVAFEARLGRL